MNESAIRVQPPPLPGRSARIVFSGARPDFRRLVMRGALLELCTAGIYRFWLATDMRRHMWSHTSLEGDAAEYTGTAKELLIGFLVALAILVPIYLVYLLIGIEAERAQAFASIPLVIFFYAFSQFAIYRARLYRASRTIWRGVRFWMTGSGWSYSWRACLWMLFAILTLGIALPWREAALERYKMRHSFYGDLQGQFVGTGWQLFKRVWWVWLLSLPLITLPLTYPVYKGMVWRWWIGGIRFNRVRFETALLPEEILGLYGAVIGWSLLLTFIYIAVAALGAFVVSLILGDWEFAWVARVATEYPYLGVALNIAGYLVFALALGVAIRIFLFRGVWERVANSVTVYGLEALDDVRARGDAVSALGEGFADSLDIGGI
jgi:uncharacterized membrane protein YjgN (DUF898 family)